MTINPKTKCPNCKKHTMEFHHEEAYAGIETDLDTHELKLRSDTYHTLKRTDLEGLKHFVNHYPVTIAFATEHWKCLSCDEVILRELDSLEELLKPIQMRRSKYLIATRLDLGFDYWDDDFTVIQVTKD